MLGGSALLEAAGQRFVDLYTPFHSQPDLAALYFPDGIHPNALGNAIVEAAMRAALDNCPAADNPDQADTSSDGIGDACQCGDVDGSGSVSLVDAVILMRAFLAPPSAAMARPELCDVGGSEACTVADAAIIRHSLLSPSRARLARRCVDLLD